MAITSTKRPIRSNPAPDGFDTPDPAPVSTIPLDPVDPVTDEEEDDESGDGESEDTTDPVDDADTGLESDAPPERPLADQGFEPVKRGRGRPKGSGKRQIEEAQAEQLANRQADFLPRPSNFRYINKPVLFFRYWEKVHKDFPDRVVCYVYRQWPVIDRERLGKTKNIDKPQQPISAQNHRQEILHRYGSGDYKLILNDSLINKAVCTATVSGLREMADFPPMVDLEELVAEDPSNRPFVERLHQRGIKLPGEPGYGQQQQGEQDGGDNMTNKALDTISAMSERMVATQERRIEQLQRQQQSMREQPENVEQMAAGSAMEIVSNAAHMANTILKEATDKVSTALATNNDPLKNITALIEVAKQMAPKEKTDTSPEFIRQMLELQAKSAEKQEGLYMMMINQQTARMAALENMMTGGGTPGHPMGAGMAPLGAGMAVAAPPPGGFLSDLDNMVKVKNRLEEIGILPSGDDKRGGDGWTQYIPMILTGLQFVAGSYASIVHNQAVARGGAGAAVAPPTPPAPQMAAGDDQSQQQQQQQYQQQYQQNQQQEQPGDNMQLRTMIDFLHKIEQPMLMHLKQGLSGADFADWLILSEEKGQLIYDSLVESGKGNILSLLRLHPPIWSVVAGIPQRFDQFLDEFLTGVGGDGDDGGDDGQDGQDGQEPQPVATVATSATGMAPLAPEILQERPERPERPQAQPQPLVIDVKPVRVRERRK